MFRQLDRDRYLGLPRRDALALALSEGWRPRFLSMGAVITPEYETDRLNLTLDARGLVCEVTAG